MIPLPREFALAVACCRWPRSEASRRAIAQAAAVTDWPMFRRVVHKHRVEGLAWDGLRQAEVDVPAETASALAADASQIVRQNLLIVAESFRLDRALASAGTERLFLKGVTLSVLAYGSVALKRGWDIDLIVPRDQLKKAIGVLKDGGYRCTHPGSADGTKTLLKWHEHAKESVWKHEARGYFVELHSSLVDNPALLPELGARSPSQDVELQRGRSLSTLAKDELFAYLCVHGASSGWFRLKWAADLAAYLSDNGPDENDRLYHRSQQLGAGRAAAQALLLASHLFGTRLSSELVRRLRSDPLNRWLFSSALELMAGRHVTAELHEKRLGTLPIHLMQFALLPGWRFKISELKRQFASVGG